MKIGKGFVIAASVLVAAAAALLGCGESSEADAGFESNQSQGWAELSAVGRLSVLDLRSPWGDSAGIEWSRLPAVSLRLYPQRVVQPGLEETARGLAELRATTDGERIALRIEWPDASEDRYSRSHTDRFADALAVQFVADDGDVLPYIGMGEPERPVFIWFWRAGQQAEVLTARGFGTLKPDAGAARVEAEAVRAEGGWSLILSGPLPAGANPLALSVAVWDGAEAGRDGRKRLTAWHLLHLPEQAADAARRAALTDAMRVDGDPGRGRRLVQERGCTACHHLPGLPGGNQGPDLTLAGGLHWPDYLRRSIVEPDAFVVPGAGHRNPEGGSLMPALDLPEDEVEDITAYLSSLVR